MLLNAILYMTLGIFSGTLAGFFGIGGGVILVPALIFFLKLSGDIPREIFMHMVLGTSLACIFITALNSVWSHHKKKNIKWNIFNKLFIGIAIGAIAGGQSANLLSSHTLKIIFAIFLTFIFIKMCFQMKPRPQGYQPHFLLYTLVGSGIGFKSSILGIGGGAISIPFLNWTGLKMKKAVGISASIGLPISFFGSLTYIYNGFSYPNLPEYSLGYVYLPAFLGIVSTSSIFARLGVRLSHHVSQEKLRKSFLVLLLVIILKTYYGIFY